MARKVVNFDQLEKTIWKYQLKPAAEQVIQMPARSEILSVGLQGTQICLWAMVAPEADLVDRVIEVIGTGNPIVNRDRQLIGLVMPTPYVFHVFEVAPSGQNVCVGFDPIEITVADE
jgi:hypothetical protein